MLNLLFLFLQLTGMKWVGGWLGFLFVLYFQEHLGYLYLYSFGD